MNLLNLYKNRKRVLGRNERNLSYIRPFNSGRAKDIADDKLLTKKILSKEGIPTPELIKVINNIEEINSLNWEKLPKSFALKPVQGIEGAGIEIFYNRDKNGDWIRADGSKASVNQLRIMLTDILDGKYSLHNQKDRVFFEERVKPHKDFKYYSYMGTPDVRVIVFNSIPVMSYIRLPTKASNGKANLAIGAIGAAIDMGSGITTNAIIGKGTRIETIPGTKLSVSGLKIPYWNELLKIAIKVQKATNLGFAAVDFLIDREKGPLVIELNARAGLSIQLANDDGLRWRLKKAGGIKIESISKGIRMAKDLFGGQIEEKLELASGKQVVSHIEPIDIITEKGTKISTLALIDTSRRTTTIQATLAKKAGIIPEEKEIEETSISDITFDLAGQSVSSDCRIVPSKIRGYNILIGRKDLGDFLIDIRRVATGKEHEQKDSLISAKPFTKPEKVDNTLSEIIKEIRIVPNIKPKNLKSEAKKFQKDSTYNPQFEYKAINLDTDKLFEKLLQLNPDPGTKIGKIFIDKIEELRKQIWLLEAIGDDDKFPDKSVQLYKESKEEIFDKALEVVKETYQARTLTQRQNGEKIQKKSIKYLSKNEVKDRLEIALKKLNLDTEIKFVTGTEAPNKASFVLSDKLLINKKYKFTKEKLEGTIAHEIEIHALRGYYGGKQKYSIFKYGTADYIEIEEGLAVLNKSEKLKSSQPIRNSALQFVSVYYAHSHSYSQTYKYLLSIGLSESNAFNYTYRAKRGLANTSRKGAFLKDSLYFSGYLKVKELTDKQKEELIKNGKTHEVINL